MSRVDELIAELCPDGVPHRTLGEVGQFKRGRRFTKADVAEDGIPSIHYGEIYTHYGVAAVETVSHVRADLATQLRFARQGDVVIAGVGETVEDVGKGVAWLGTAEVAIHDDCFIYRHSMDPKYVSYYLRTEAFRSQKSRHVARAKVKRLSAQGLAGITVPVPPLEVQREIVRVLDTFTELEAELEEALAAELEARRRQYAHYRDALLTFPEGGVRWIPMGEVGSVFGGLTGKTKADFADGNARFVSYVAVFNNIAVDVEATNLVRVGAGERQRTLRRGDVLFTGSSETAEDVGMSSVMTNEPSEPLYLNSFCIGYRPHAPSPLDPEFAKHLFRSAALRKQIVRTASGVTRFNVSKTRLVQVEIPIPSMEEQRRIAAILDRFDALVNNLSIGLPAELAARRKQYEHYCDRLLTFKEAAA